MFNWHKKGGSFDVDFLNLGKLKLAVSNADCAIYEAEASKMEHLVNDAGKKFVILSITDVRELVEASNRELSLKLLLHSSIERWELEKQLASNPQTKAELGGKIAAYKLLLGE